MEQVYLPAAALTSQGAPQEYGQDVNAILHTQFRFPKLHQQVLRFVKLCFMHRAGL
jgi:hypothetical protein